MSSTPPDAARHAGMVWVVGLNRTGTTSLAHALCILGYPNLHYPEATYMVRRDRSIFMGWKGGSDIPIAAFYRELDRDYPGSRFILSTRDRERWLRSVVEHFEKVPRELDETDSGLIRTKVYGVARPSPEQFREAWDRHHADVREYFRGRDDFIEFDASRGDGWEVLCPFLGVPTPDVPFPNTNRADGRDENGSPEAIARHKQLALRLLRERQAAQRSFMGQLNRLG